MITDTEAGKVNINVLAVVVTFNRIGMLKKCIESLCEQTVRCNILIIDNHSTDGTGEYVKSLSDERITYADTGSNLGGAGGFSYGMDMACGMECDAVWVMDDDCFPEPDALEKLLEAGDLVGGIGSYGFISSAVLWTDGSECRINRQHIVKNAYEHVEWLKHGVVRIDQATFVSILVPTDIIRRFGLPIKEFFIWGDDIEYTQRIAMRGKMPCYLAGASTVTHAMSDNVGSDISLDSAEKIPRYRYGFRNERYALRKLGIKGWSLYHYRRMRDVFRVIIRAKDHRMKRLGTIIIGMVQGIFFWPKIEYPKK